MHARTRLTRAATIAAFAPVLWGVPALASNSANAPSVDLVREISFGTIAIGSGSGEVTVTTDGALRCTGGLQCLGGQTAGAFVITGAKDEMVSIMVTPSRLDDGKGHQLTATFTPSTRTLVLRPGNAKNPFTVGGTLSAPAGLVEGSYSGTFDVIVDYQ